jgi:S1-C subfamily serine protease
MAESDHWAFPDAVQPKADEVRFELAAVLDAVVQLRSEVPEDAFTASILGTERLGSGVAIGDERLVLTIGYLITEAQSIWLTTNGGAVVPGYPLAYDQVTGFGLVQPLGRLDVPVLARGSSAACAVGEEMILVGHGGQPHALKTRVIAKREFAGYWEYLLDEAIFTAPAHPQWGGAALVGMDGHLLGIGSLLVQEVVAGQAVQGNMIVPVDLLAPIYEDLRTRGSANRPPRPWLGMYTTEAEGSAQLVVAGLADGGPADRAGVKRGDLVLEVAGSGVTGLADLFRKVWRLGPVGVEVLLTLAREGSMVRVAVRSADRNDFLKKPQLH